MCSVPSRTGRVVRGLSPGWSRRCGTLPRMPWIPELFSEPVLQRFLDKQQRDTIVDVPFFDGLIAGETDALVGSFAGEPEVHHPVRGRIKGVKAFTAFVAEMSAWFADRNVEVEDVERVVLSARGFEEVLLRVDGDGGR